MKTKDQIQRAHDMIIGVLLGDVPVRFEGEQAEKALRATADVLCWVLEHDHNQTFQANLESIEQQIAAQGYRLHDHGN